MGHPSPDRFVRILRYAKAKPEVIEAAKQLKPSVCQRHAQVRPARRSAPPKELSFNECVGVDVVYLPTLGNRSKPALNVIDWSSKFQLMIPLPNKKPGQVREAYRHWLRLFGPPKRMALDLGREFRGTFAEWHLHRSSCSRGPSPKGYHRTPRKDIQVHPPENKGHLQL